MDLMSPAQLEDAYSRADLALLPMVGNIPYSQIAGECAAWGLPIISSPGPGMSEVLRNDFNGFTENPKRLGALAIDVEKLLESPGLRQEQAENGFKLYRKNLSRTLFLDRFMRLSRSEKGLITHSAG